jgi:hypothetical protein
MSITGRIKFFEPSQCLGVNGSEISASSGDSSATYALDRNPDTKWRSVDSDDLTAETITVTFAEDIAISRLLFLDINWKQFTVKYDVAGAWTNFAAVVGLDSTGGALISETAFSDDSAYYEFTEVTTSAIQITVLKTQVADEQKYCAQIIATTEIGTFLGWPEINAVKLDRNLRKRKTLSGKVSVMKSLESTMIDIRFKDYPSNSTYNADMDIAMELHDRENPFIIWLCGGRRGTYFNYILRGFRLRDAITVQMTDSMDLSYTSNGYKNQLNASLRLEEHI